MKILILSCRTGEGHNSAAKAVKEALDDFGAECELVDALTFSGRRPNEIVTNSYNRMIVKAPNMFGLIYKAPPSLPPRCIGQTLFMRSGLEPTLKTAALLPWCVPICFPWRR